MPHHSKLSSSKAIQNACAIAASPTINFLLPAHHRRDHRLRKLATQHGVVSNQCPPRNTPNLESFFFSALLQASSCHQHQRVHVLQKGRRSQHKPNHKASYSTVAARSTVGNEVASDGQGQKEDAFASRARRRKRDGVITNTRSQLEGDRARMLQWLEKGHEDEGHSVNSWFPSDFFGNSFEQRFAKASRLPPGFFGDVKALQSLTTRIHEPENSPKSHGRESHTSKNLVAQPASDTTDGVGRNNEDHVEQQLKLLESVRELENKLARAKSRLKSAIIHESQHQVETSIMSRERSVPIVLKKEDYINLVDLYFHSHNSRFSPEATDLSPTPTFLDDFSFKLSGDFSNPDSSPLNEDEDYESPLKQVHVMLKSKKLREIAAMQIFIDLLLDDQSSNRALYEAYRGLPDPGVAHLPGGVVRLFLQRMSTPWTHSEKSMLRYLALVDDMQKAKIPMTTSEWSSAVYLAGRSFARVTDTDVASSLKIWSQMEHEAGVQSSHVTFNILFDIAVRAGKFALGQTILMEMSKRNLRLNRLGRVSLIYYHGLRGDGDGVRKTYRDFVEAGEIVDSLVLNCVIASLYNAQEPAAAEQVYERMKSMFARLQRDTQADGTEAYYLRYPPPGESTIDREMASNHLGRILERAPTLRRLLPEHHKELQAAMPLVPDFNTFRTMIAYHATKSGDLDRMSVLLSEMTDLFGMPLRTLIFQFLFKGFALHGPTGGPDGRWSVKRLDLCWNAFREAVKDTRAKAAEEEMMAHRLEPTLPNITAINSIPPDAPIPAFKPRLHNPPMKRLSTWNEFVLDLVIFPRERLRRIERFHAQMFDDENAPKPHESRRPHTFSSPFFQSTVYQAPEPRLDHEEGEYVLPSPTDTAMFQPACRSPQEHDAELGGQDDTEMEVDLVPEEHDDKHGEHDPFADAGDATGRFTHHDFHQHKRRPNLDQWHSRPNQSRANSSPKTTSHRNNNTITSSSSSNNNSSQVTPTRPLICWLLRAYARNTKSRTRVEEIWGSVRKIWQPRDAMERESVVRVLRRCLRDCDREGGTTANSRR